jgi:hypothetical protein
MHTANFRQKRDYLEQSVISILMRYNVNLPFKMNLLETSVHMLANVQERSERMHITKNL